MKSVQVFLCAENFFFSVNVFFCFFSWLVLFFCLFRIRGFYVGKSQRAAHTTQKNFLLKNAQNQSRRWFWAKSFFERYALRVGISQHKILSLFSAQETWKQVCIPHLGCTVNEFYVLGLQLCSLGNDLLINLFSLKKNKERFELQKVTLMICIV